MKDAKNTYLPSVDFLRGMAALAVCAFHFVGARTDVLPEGNPIRTISSYGHFGVEVFFVISGLIIPYSMLRGSYAYDKIKTFFLKRVTRIEPPYIISAILVLLLNYLSTLTPFYSGEPVSYTAMELVSHIGYLTEVLGYVWLNPVYWTLAIEFQYYILIALAFPLLISPNRAVWISTLAVFNVLHILVPSDSFIFVYSLFFTLGILNFKYKFEHFSLKEFLLLSSIVMGLILATKGIPHFVAALVPFLFINFISIDNKVSRFLGNISFSLYLIHLPVGGRIINLSLKFVQHEYMRVLVIILTVLLCVLCAYIFYRLIEKPAMTMSKKIKYKGKEEHQPETVAV